MHAHTVTRRSCLAHCAALSLGALAPATARAGGGRRPVVINMSLDPHSLDPPMDPAAALGEVVHHNVLAGTPRIAQNSPVTPLLA